ncbi:hypothetical protein ONE63_000537 [Megalurothrips usitatus]|uniref:Uncharacterized protein n=1 Tax=Megalurothrips usitatus TaxID=439358 RepID=A0AAV7Y1A3_9NEOP|nr:hypothetical protein ONE63_000537 [Megalurothrips usitatus]
MQPHRGQAPHSLDTTYKKTFLRSEVADGRGPGRLRGTGPHPAAPQRPEEAPGDLAVSASRRRRTPVVAVLPLRDQDAAGSRAAPPPPPARAVICDSVYRDV